MPYSTALVETVEIRTNKRRVRKPRRDMMHPFNLPQSRWFKNGEIKRGRDSYRERCYRAERAVRTKHGGKEFADIAELRYFLRHFMESAWFQARFPDFTACVVEYNPKMRNAHAGPRRVRRDHEGERVVTAGSMTIGTRCLNPMICLHELAHAVLPHEHMHDRRWLRTFLEFVRSGLGEGAYEALRDACKDEKLKYNPWRRGGGAPPAVLRKAAAKAQSARKEKS